MMRVLGVHLTVDLLAVMVHWEVGIKIMQVSRIAQISF